MNPREQLQSALTDPEAYPFHQIQRLIEELGFKLVSMHRLHNVFIHPQIPELVCLQNVNSRAKPYQLQHFLTLIDQYHLGET